MLGDGQDPCVIIPLKTDVRNDREEADTNDIRNSV
ncbi:hypothetical protein RD1_0986 [Roseobacter denitrificans OCh 114]|uniref:Uncharacterized protein n=1 Tax=Roseobacter denitrificans (strain ATCC 33942 / OCh 114) TaxID=375451 RepID=Q16BJ0_ROSDO|nr:hypothetical protein RD1_0986 [Roseobacter denitrificans OCh 114]